MTEPVRLAPVSFDQIITFIHTVLFPLVGYCVYVLRDIRSELKKMNNRMTKLETWSLEHEKLDRTQMDALQRELDNLTHGHHRGSE